MAHDSGFEPASADFPLKVVIAPNAFKGSVSAWEAACALEEGIRKGLPEAETVKIPMADGGDGTADALVRAVGGRFIEREVSGPLGKPVKAKFAVLGEGETAVIEMALASGIALLNPWEMDPGKATTYGTGELIKSALDEGCGKIVVGIGGSATNDGGSGMAEALGARFLAKSGIKLGRGGASLSRLEKIDVSCLDERVSKTEIVIASDVRNPLCGSEGASLVYGPQKGASPEMAEKLDAALFNFSRTIEKDLGIKIAEVPGSGAAGGLGAGLMAFLGAKMRSGVEIVMELTGFEKAVRGAFIVVTGEGKIDSQTPFGKAPGEIAKKCRKKKIPVVGVCGSLSGDVDMLYESGFDSFLPIIRGPCSLQYALDNAAELLEDSGRRLAGFIGMAARRRGKKTKK